MKKTLIILVILILGSIAVMSVEPQPEEGGVLSLVPQCNQEGGLILTISAFNIPSEFWVYTEDIDVWLIDEKGIATSMNDKGTWDSVRIKDAQDITQRTAVFTTGIDTIHNAGDYKIRLNYKAGASKDIDKRSREEVDYEQEKIFHCDGYIFSCSALELNVDSCTSDGKTLRIEHTVKGLTQSPAATIDLETVKYSIEAEKQYTDIEGKTSRYGGMPMGSKISSNGDKFSLEAPFEDNNIEAVTVSYDISTNKYTKECLNIPTLSASAVCNKPAEVRQEEQKEEQLPQEEKKEEGLEGITGAAVSEPKTYSTKTKLLIAAIVVIIVIIIGYYATREKEDKPEEPKEQKEEKK